MLYSSYRGTRGSLVTRGVDVVLRIISFSPIPACAPSYPRMLSPAGIFLSTLAQLQVSRVLGGEILGGCCSRHHRRRRPNLERILASLYGVDMESLRHITCHLRVMGVGTLPSERAARGSPQRHRRGLVCLGFRWYWGPFSIVRRSRIAPFSSAKH